jgi:gamma-glutamyl hercynylcysteine S-oxide synthase
MNRTRTIIATVVVTGAVMMLAGTGSTIELMVPPDMVYVGHGPSIIGIDKKRPSESTKKPSAYDKRMNQPWSAEAFDDEGPAHMVFLDSYLLDKYEVSNKDFGAFVKAKGHAAPAYWDDPRLNKPEQPVVGVTWEDAKVFCEYRGKRLPTEAEWEKAARGPTATIYPWGNEFDPANANYGKTHDATMPVNSNPEGVSYYGAYHMAGNVFEWVSDWYDPRYYDRLEPMVNPTGPAKAVWIGGTGTYVDRLTVGEKRVIRGGSWIAPEATLRTTHRFWNHPLNNSYGVGLGFRCAKAAPPQLDQQIKDAYIAALVEMGREQFAEAQQKVTQGLAIDPKNVELLELQQLIERSTKKS